MKRSIVISIIIQFILMPAAFGSEFTNLTKSEREARRQKGQNERYKKKLSRDLGYFKTMFWKGSGDVNEVKTIEKGLILMGGVLIHPPIQIEFGNDGTNINKLDFKRSPKIIGEIRPPQYSEEEQKFMDFYKGLGDVRSELYSRNATDEEFIEKMREYIEKHEVYIEKVDYREYSVSVHCKNKLSCTIYYRTFEEDMGYPEKDPNAVATYDAVKAKPNNRLIKKQQELCECLEKDMVVYRTDGGNFKCLDKSFVQRIDQIVKSVELDESKLVSEYLDTLNLIIEELHKIGIYGSKANEANRAAIILANWNRDPVEVLKEARARAEAKEGAGLVNGR